MSAKDHADEVLSLVRSAAGRTRVHDGLVPDNPALPYVVVYLDFGAPESTSVNDAKHMTWREFQTTFVGETPEQVRALFDRAAPAILGTAMDVYRTSATPIEQVASQPVSPDFDTRPPRFFAAVTWGYWANT